MIVPLGAECWSPKKLIETMELLAARETGFRSLTEAIDTTTAGGKLVFPIIGSLAECERSILRKRSRAGLDAAWARVRRQCCRTRTWPWPRSCSPIRISLSRTRRSGFMGHRRRCTSIGQAVEAP